MIGGIFMTVISEPVWDKILHLSAEQIPAFTAFVENLTETKPVSMNTAKRIGVAKNITFPANFDEIDYGTAELFGLSE